MTVAELEVLITARVDQLKKELDQADAEIRRFAGKGGSTAKGASDTMTGHLRRISEAAMPIGRDLTTFVTAPLMAVGGMAIKSAAEFQRSMNVLQATSGATGSQMERLRGTARALGADLTLPGTSAADAVAAMLELSKAGLSVKDTMGAARGVLQMSAAAQIGNARAAEIAAGAMNAFKLAGTEAGRVADLFAGAANASAAGAEDLAQGFQAGATSAAQAGLSIGQFATALAAMANAGIKGSDAGTSIKAMLAALTPASKPAAEAMEAIGFSAFDANGKMKPLPAILDELARGMAGLTQERRMTLMEQIFGSDGVRAASVLIGLGTDGFQRLAAAVGKQGSAAQMAAAQNKGVLGALDALQSATESLLTGEGGKGLPMVERALKAIANAINSFGNLPDPTKNLVIGIGATAAVAGPAILALGAMAGAISSVGALFAAGGVFAAGGTVATALTAVAGILTGPVGLAVAGAVAAVVALAAAWRGNWGGIRDAVTAAVGRLMPVIDGIGKFVRETWAAALRTVSGLVAEFAPLVVSAWRNISAQLSVVIAPIAAFVKGVFGGIRQFLTDHGTQIRAVLSGAWQAISGVFTTAFGVIKGIVKTALQLMGGDFRGAWETIKGTVSGFAEGIVGIVRGMGKFFREAAELAIDGFVAGVRTAGSAAWGAVRKWAEGVASTVRGALGIKSPSRVFREIAEFAVAGFGEGLSGGAGLRGAMDRAVDEMFTGRLADLGTNLARTLRQSLAQMGQEFLKARLGELLQRALGGASSSPVGGGGRPWWATLGSVLGNVTRFLPAAGGGVAGTVSKGLPSLTAALGAIAGRATGGPVERGVPYLVGERGPELVVPGQSGTVVPARATREVLAAGGPSLVVNITVHATDAGSFQRSERQIAGSMTRELRRALARG